MSVRKLLRNEVESVLKQLVTKQGGTCGICSKPFTRTDGPVLDHNHDTGIIRGACHRSCNGAEGRVKTRAQMGHKGVAPDDYMIGLGKYLEFHKIPKVLLLHPSHKSDDEKRIERNLKARKARAAKTSTK